MLIRAPTVVGASRLRVKQADTHACTPHWHGHNAFQSHCWTMKWDETPNICTCALDTNGVVFLKVQKTVTVVHLSSALAQGTLLIASYWGHTKKSHGWWWRLSVCPQSTTSCLPCSRLQPKWASSKTVSLAKVITLLSLVIYLWTGGLLDDTIFKNQKQRHLIKFRWQEERCTRQNF